VGSTETHINQYCASFDELVSGLTVTGKYDHLRLILSKNDNQSLGQRYLMVSRTSFGLVRLCDVDFDDNHVYFDLQDISTGKVKRVPVDINDPAFGFLLISWADIRELVINKADSNLILDDLLEFDF
jgi:hypothetical protein